MCSDILEDTHVWLRPDTGYFYERTVSTVKSSEWWYSGSARQLSVFPCPLHLTPLYREKAHHPISCSQRPERAFEEVLCGGHVLLDIRLQVPGAGLPIVGAIAHVAGEEDELVGITRRQHQVRCIPRTMRCFISARSCL